VLCPLCNAHFRVFLESAGTGTNRPFAEFSPPQPQSHTTPAFSTIPLAHPSSDPAFGPASAPLYTEPSSFFPPPYPPLPIVGPGDVPQTAALSSDMAESYQFSVVPPPDAPFGGTFNGGLAQLHPDLAAYSTFGPAPYQTSIPSGTIPQIGPGTGMATFTQFRDAGIGAEGPQSRTQSNSSTPPYTALDRNLPGLNTQLSQTSLPRRPPVMASLPKTGISPRSARPTPPDPSAPAPPSSLTDPRSPSPYVTVPPMPAAMYTSIRETSHMQPIDGLTERLGELLFSPHEDSIEATVGSVKKRRSMGFKSGSASKSAPGMALYRPVMETDGLTESARELL
jgi:hypothetical protein